MLRSIGGKYMRLRFRDRNYESQKEALAQCQKRSLGNVCQELSRNSWLRIIRIELQPIQKSFGIAG